MEPLPVVNCSGCGRCCSQQGTPPMMPDEYDSLPVELRWDIDAHADRYDLGLPCLWFDGERCQHYEHRPTVCRDFPTGGAYCLRFRAEPPVLPGPPPPPDGDPAWDEE